MEATLAEIVLDSMASPDILVTLKLEIYYEKT